MVERDEQYLYTMVSSYSKVSLTNQLLTFHVVATYEINETCLDVIFCWIRKLTSAHKLPVTFSSFIISESGKTPLQPHGK